VLAPNAAGVDVGAREMFVAVPPGRDEHPERVFTTFTEDLPGLADWLVQCGGPCSWRPECCASNQRARRWLVPCVLILSLTFFNDYEGDIVSLRHALSEFLNGLQEFLLERVTSRGGLLLDER
jgi:hypothetical protein